MDTLSTIHVGNGALLENTIKLCRQVYGECEFHIITMDRETNKLKYDADRLYAPMFGNFWFGLNRAGKLWWAGKNSFFMLLHILNENSFRIPSGKLTFTPEQNEAIQAIEQSDVCVSCGGEIVGDTFWQALPFWLFTYWMATKKGKPLILFPQSIGPLKKWWTRTLVKKALKNATLMVGRDKPSYETLLSLGFDPKRVMFVPDVAIQQATGAGDIHAYFPDQSKKVVGITISNPPWNEMGKKIDFIESIGSEIEKLDPNKYKILLMPSNYVRNGISTDYALCHRLKERLAKSFEAGILQNRPYFPDEYTALLSQLEFFISTRMHVAIMATSVATPTITINTQHKIRGYMQNIGMEHFCVEYDSIHNISSLTQEIFDSSAEIVERLKEANGRLIQEHEVFVTRLQECVH